MEENQLNLNSPLLSVRRLSTTSSNLDRLYSNSNRKLTPTRQQSLPVSKSQRKPEQEDTKPAAIPFIWEQIPEKSKNRKNPVSQNPKNTTFCSGPIPIDEHLAEDVHTDANETLSMSFSCNFSDDNSDVESSRSFSSDLQTRDYLMNRFLPASKSMIVEIPQYVAKNQDPPVLEPPKYVKKVYSGELGPLKLLPEKYSTNSYKNEKDKESVVMVVVEKKKSRKKGFGFFFPRICTNRASLCLSDQNPGSKTKIRQSRSSFAESPGPVPRLSRRTSYSGPLTPSLEKQAMDAVIRKRAESRSKEMHETRKSNPLTRSGESLPSSPHRGISRSGRISPYRNESPRSPFHDGARFLGLPKDVQNQILQPKTCPSLNIKSHFSSRLTHDSPSLVPEKTLYIDWVEKPTNPTLNDAKIESNGGDLVRVLPLPKSPSESWLWRKMTLRSSFPKKPQQAPIEKNPKYGPNWETVVKTSNVHHDHVHYSEELLNVSMYPEISF